MSFLTPFWERLDRMAAASRIVNEIDPCPLPEWGKMHPMAAARRDAFHFVFRERFPDESVEGELEDLKRRLGDSRGGYRFIEVNGVTVRVSVGDMVRWNPDLEWVFKGQVVRGCYEDLRGIHIKCWGLEGPPSEDRAVDAVQEWIDT